MVIQHICDLLVSEKKDREEIHKVYYWLCWVTPSRWFLHFQQILFFFCCRTFCTAFGETLMWSSLEMLCFCSAMGKSICVCSAMSTTGLWSMIKHPTSGMRAGTYNEEDLSTAHTPFITESIGDSCDLRITSRIITQRHRLWHEMSVSSHNTQLSCEILATGCCIDFKSLKSNWIISWGRKEGTINTGLSKTKTPRLCWKILDHRHSDMRKVLKGNISLHTRSVVITFPTHLLLFLEDIGYGFGGILYSSCADMLIYIRMVTHDLQAWWDTGQARS